MLSLTWVMETKWTRRLPCPPTSTLALSRPAATRARSSGPAVSFPDAYFSSVSYVWRLEDDQAPFGLSSVVGGSLFPRSSTAAPSPMLAVARAVPYLARDNPTAEDYFFAPNWDVRLTPLDSAGVHDISNDTAYNSHSLNTVNLEDLRRHVLLPLGPWNSCCLPLRPAIAL